MMDVDAIRAAVGDKAARIEHIGGQVLIQGDCLEVMPLLGKVDAVVTDPPYGIGESGGEKNRYKEGRTRFQTPKHQAKGWDIERPKDAIIAIAQIDCRKIIWGGNYFADLLPPKMGWLYWDKMIGGDFSDGELAWTSRDGALRQFRMHPFCGLSGGKDRVHPTQKPAALMEWCLGFLPNAQAILDPFMGSGTTLVACQNLDRNGIGIELDPDYFAIACKRVDEATRQPRLFSEPAPAPVQEGMDL